MRDDLGFYICVFQVLHVSPLHPQVEYGTFDTVALANDSGVVAAAGSPSAAVEQGLQFGRALVLGPYLVTWCSTHVWLLQPVPALTVIAACRSEPSSPIIDVCVDQQSILLLRQCHGSKVDSLVRLTINVSSGSASPSRSRASSVNNPLPSASDSQATSTGSAHQEAVESLTMKRLGAEIGLSSPLSEESKAPSDSTSAKLHSSMSALTDRLKNLVSKGSTSIPVEDIDHAQIAGYAHVSASSSHVVATSTTSSDGSRQEVSSDATVPMSDQPAVRAPLQSHSGWLDKLRTRGSAQAAESEAASTPSPAMPATQTHGVRDRSIY